MSELAAPSHTPRPSSPKPQKSLNRQVVLEEDEYTAALSQIIARDFFPSLVHLDATNNYLDALRSEDPQLINASVRQLQDLATPLTGQYRPQQTPSQTPYAGGPTDTPLRTPSTSSARPTKRARYDTDMSLDAFQARYTSEDNSSFTQILDDENRKRAEKWGWAWEAQRRVEAQRDKMIEARDRLLIEPHSVPGVKEKLVIEPPTAPAGLITASGEKQDEVEVADGITVGEDEQSALEVAVVPAGEEAEPVDVMARRKDTRVAGVDGWKFKTRNAFMFPPDADVTPYASSSTSAAAATRGEPKAVKYANTRLPEQDETSSMRGASEPPSPTRSRIDAAITGTPYRPRSPTINNFSLLPTMPSPTPSELGPAAVKQLMTWGTLNATPRIISSDDPADLPSPSTPFHLPAPSSREAIGHKLSNNASRSLREKAARMSGGSNFSTRSGGMALGSRTPGGIRSKTTADGSMLPPTWTPRKVAAAGSLTPAGRRLLDRTIASGVSTGVAGARRAEVMGKAAGWEGSGAKAKETDLNKVRWTPSPAAVSRKR